LFRQITYQSKADNLRVDKFQFVVGSGICAPMLAQKYSPDGQLSGSKTLEKMKILGLPIHVQPKLDGNRCLAKVSKDSIELYTRKGDRVLPIPHIERQLRASYDENITNGATLILDGELYTNAFSFNTLNGLVRKQDKTPDDYALLEEVKYHIYDVVSEHPYEIRYSIINTNFHTPGAVCAVPSYSIRADDGEIRKMMEIFLAQGFEGLMIRRLDMPYENKRSWSLCKYKDFQDAEYRCVGIVEDVRGNGVIGAFVMELATPVKDRDGREIKTFNAGIKDLSHDESRKMLENKNEYIGRTATVEFFSLSEYSIPRFPKLKGFRADV